MPQFSYKARRRSGEVVVGMLVDFNAVELGKIVMMVGNAIPASGSPFAAPVATSHSLTVLSSDPVARVLESGENAHPRTQSVCPCRVCSTACDLASWILAVLSADADA